MADDENELDLIARIKRFVGTDVKEKSFRITPIGKPRMTQRDHWARRGCVLAYWAYRDEIKKQQRKFRLPSSQFWILYILPMPERWSEKKKLAMQNTAHMQKPDKDNLDKAFFDAITAEEKVLGTRKLTVSDAQIWDSGSTKI